MADNQAQKPDANKTPSSPSQVSIKPENKQPEKSYSSDSKEKTATPDAAKTGTKS